jgi:hypothetical protein
MFDVDAVDPVGYSFSAVQLIAVFYMRIPKCLDCT